MRSRPVKLVVSDLPPHHPSSHLSRRRLPSVNGLHQPTIPEDSDPISQPKDLFHLVRDIEDGVSLRSEPGNRPFKTRRLCLR